MTLLIFAKISFTRVLQDSNRFQSTGISSVNFKYLFVFSSLEKPIDVRNAFLSVNTIAPPNLIISTIYCNRGETVTGLGAIEQNQMAIEL